MFELKNCQIYTVKDEKYFSAANSSPIFSLSVAQLLATEQENLTTMLLRLLLQGSCTTHRVVVCLGNINDHKNDFANNCQNEFL